MLPALLALFLIPIYQTGASVTNNVPLNTPHHPFQSALPPVADSPRSDGQQTTQPVACAPSDKTAFELAMVQTASFKRSRAGRGGILASIILLGLAMGLGMQAFCGPPAIPTEAAGKAALGQQGHDARSSTILGRQAAMRIEEEDLLQPDKEPDKKFYLI